MVFASLICFRERCLTARPSPSLIILYHFPPIVARGSGKIFHGLLSEYEHCLERRDKFHRTIARIVAQEPMMVRLLQVPGIATITAFALVAYVEDIHRFSTASKLVAYIGLNPMVNSSGEDGDPDVLSTYGQRVLKVLFIQVGQALMRRKTSHGISRWARAKNAAGKPYLVMCVAAGRKAIVYAWHNMMGHPVPDRESEKMFRTKTMAIYKGSNCKTYFAICIFSRCILHFTFSILH